MIRFQCPFCRGIIASDVWEPGAPTVCAYCSKEVKMPADRLSPGMVLGDFLLVRKLGAGGMGVVYLAHQLSLDRPAAIKILNSEYSKDSESVQAFIREARSAAKLNHPNIVQAYAVGEDEGIFFFAMEFIDGKTMKEIMQEKGKIEPKKAASIIMQVANALDCAWKEQKLIHHDIKPDNIMQCSNERIKLADLGLSAVFGEDANDESDEVLGTPQYISPEQLTGVQTDTRSDIYSLGATFYHLVTGQFPYNAENTDEIAKMHVYGTLTPPKTILPELPQTLNDIIVKMMAKTPEARYQDCSEVAKVLKDFLEKGDTPGGLGGGLSGNKGLGGNTLSQATAKLSGGLSSGGVQPKLAVPSSPAKLSIKVADRVNKDAVPGAPENAAGETADAPEVKPAAAPKIKLAVAAAKPVEPPKAPETAEENAESPAAEPEKTEENSVEPAAESTSEKAAENVPPENDAPVAGEKSPAEDKNADSCDAEDDNDDKGSGKAVLIIVSVVLLLAVAGGAFYFWNNSRKAKAKPAAVEVKKSVPAAIKPEPKAVETEVVEAEPQPAVAVPAQPQVPKAPVLSAFMREAKRLEGILLNNEREFVRIWRSSSAKLKPANKVETEFLKQLEDSFLDADERLNILPARKTLIDGYNRTVAYMEKRADSQEYLTRIRNAEKAAFDLAEESAENYRKDLNRKMSMLDYAMINAVKSGNAANWTLFQKAVAAAKAEPQRVADREGFKPVADMLAEYAARTEFAAGQAKTFPAELQKNKFKNHLIGRKALIMDKVLKRWLAEAYEKGVKDPKSRIKWNMYEWKTFEIDWKESFRLVSTNRTVLNFSVAMQVTPKVVPVKAKPKKGKKAAKPKPPKPVKFTVTASVNIATRACSGTLVMGRIKMPLPAQKLTLVEVRDFVHCVEILHGKSDQYFYYMLCTGNMQERLSVIAPDKFWKERVDMVPRGYFKRAIFLANEQQLAALKKTYGSWLSFQNALKEMTEAK